MSTLPLLALHRRHELAMSAASGLVLRQGTAWAVADNRLQLSGLRLHDGRHLPEIALEPGAEPEIVKKKKKPDLESLIDTGDGSLVVLGSGSKALRTREYGYRVPLDGGPVRRFDLQQLYRRLARKIDDLNIEGAVRLGSRLLLAHRAVGRRDHSRIIELDAAACLHGADDAWPASAYRDSHRVVLGELDGVPLAFTDLAVHPDGGLYFVAAAENTGEAYVDGYCTGSVFGRLDAEFQASLLGRLPEQIKAEGLAWEKTIDGRDHWLVVSDADDPDRLASLLELRIG